MAIPLTINGQVFEYPQNFDEDWGVDATGWAQAVTAGALYLSGGNFPLTATVDFGSSFGLKAKSLTSKTANPSTAGYLCLAKTDAVEWRNNANNANLALGIDGSDNLTFNGTILGTTSLTNAHIFVGNASNLPVAVNLSGDATIANTGALTIANSAITNAKVSASAAIALSKLAATTASRALVSDGGGLIAPSSVTSTEIGYISGITGPVQAQIDAHLPLAGGTMSGSIGMASNKVTSLANATNPGDAVAFNQLRVFQTVFFSTTNGTAGVTSGTYVITHLLATITLTDASHRVSIQAMGCVDQPAGAITAVSLFRDSTNVLAAAGGWYSQAPTSPRVTTMATLVTVDAPGGVGPYVYSVQIKTSSGTAAFGSINGETQTIVLQEVL